METRRRFILKGARRCAGRRRGRRSHLPRDAAAGQLKILQWSHFVPAYDKWFDPWAKAWGPSKGIEVTVDHVGFADVVPRATAEVAAQSGHDIHMFLGLASAFEEHVVDLADVQATLEKKHGPPVELAKRSTYNPFTKKQFALSDMWVPDPGNYHKKVWTDIGMPGRALDLRGPGQGRARRSRRRPPRCRSPSGSACPRTSTPTWPSATSSGATGRPSRTRTATSS